MTFEKYLKIVENKTIEDFNAADFDTRTKLYRDYNAMRKRMEEVEEYNKESTYEPPHYDDEEYNEWEKHFTYYIDGINGITGSPDELREKAADKQWGALQFARRTTSDPKKLIFAETDALEQSALQEALIRCIPVGDSFAGKLSYIKDVKNKDETLSDAMKRIYNVGEDRNSIENNLIYHILKKVDKNPKAGEMSDQEIIKEVFKKDPQSYAFYIEHKNDQLPCANPANVEFTMNEIFRLGDRMGRNSRMTGPMKELCGKINALKEDYKKSPEKYKTMPSGRLNNLMNSIMFSADQYVYDKQSQRSFSSTQIERLKSINRLKSLQQSFLQYADKVTEMKNDPDYNYAMLAEKLVLHSQLKEKGGAALCDREGIQENIQSLLSERSPLKKYMQDMTKKLRNAGKSEHSEKEIFDTLLKSDGQKLLKNYQSYAQNIKSEPVKEQPVAQEPVKEQPAVQEPVKEQPAAQEPVKEQPAAQEPVKEQPVVQEPVKEQPVAQEPVKEQPAAQEPVKEQPVAQEPVKEQPVVQEPVKEQPAPVAQEQLVNITNRGLAAVKMIEKGELTDKQFQEAALDILTCNYLIKEKKLNVSSKYFERRRKEQKQYMGEIDLDKQVSAIKMIKYHAKVSSKLPDKMITAIGDRLAPLEKPVDFKERIKTNFNKLIKGGMSQRQFQDTVLDMQTCAYFAENAHGDLAHSTFEKYKNGFRSKLPQFEESLQSKVQERLKNLSKDPNWENISPKSCAFSTMECINGQQTAAKTTQEKKAAAPAANTAHTASAAKRKTIKKKRGPF